MKYRIYQEKLSYLKITLGSILCIVFGYFTCTQIYCKEISTSQSISNIKLHVLNTEEIVNNIHPLTYHAELATSRLESTLRSCLGPSCIDHKRTLTDGATLDRVGMFRCSIISYFYYI